MEPLTLSCSIALGMLLYDVIGNLINLALHGRDGGDDDTPSYP